MATLVYCLVGLLYDFTVLYSKQSIHCILIHVTVRINESFQVAATLANWHKPDRNGVKLRQI